MMEPPRDPYRIIWHVGWGDEEIVYWNRNFTPLTRWQRLARWAKGQWFYYDEYLPAEISAWIGRKLYRLADRYSSYLCMDRGF